MLSAEPAQLPCLLIFSNPDFSLSSQNNMQKTALLNFTVHLFPADEI